MRKTKAQNMNDPLMVTTEQLMRKMNCGYQTAVTIGAKAGARIYVGRRVWYNLNKVEKYLQEIAV